MANGKSETMTIVTVVILDFRLILTRIKSLWAHVYTFYMFTLYHVSSKSVHSCWILAEWTFGKTAYSGHFGCNIPQILKHGHIDRALSRLLNYRCYVFFVEKTFLSQIWWKIFFCLWHGQKKYSVKHFVPWKILFFVEKNNVATKISAALRSEKKYLTTKKNIAFPSLS